MRWLLASSNVLAAAILGLLLLVGAAVCGYRTIQAVRLTYSNKLDPAFGYRSNIEMICNRNFIAHDMFIELGGAWARLMGWSCANKTILLPNGIQTYLDAKLPPSDVLDRHARSVVRFSDSLEGCGIPYFFVLAPYKMDDQEKMLPAVANHNVIGSAKHFVRRLKDENVDVSHLRDVLAQNEDDVLKYFYKTDHHWNGDAIMVAARMIDKKMVQKLRIKNEDFDPWDEKNWCRNVLQDWFWGSLGRRTGHWFSGTDDLVYYEPKFGTQIHCEMPSRKYDKTGSFEQVVMDRTYICSRPNSYQRCAYDVYLGGVDPIVKIRNGNPLRRKKILMLNDSFGRPVSALLSSVYEVIVAIDLRFVKPGEVRDLITEMHPDIVCHVINENSLSQAAFFLAGRGSDEW